MVIVAGHAHLLGDFAFIRRPPQVLLQPTHGLIQRPGVTPYAARHPVTATQLVDHRAANALVGIGRETRAVRIVVAPHGVQQTEHAGLNEIIEFHAGG